MHFAIIKVQVWFTCGIIDILQWNLKYAFHFSTSGYNNSNFYRESYYYVTLYMAHSLSHCIIMLYDIGNDDMWKHENICLHYLDLEAHHATFQDIAENSIAAKFTSYRTMCISTTFWDRITSYLTCIMSLWHLVYVPNMANIQTQQKSDTFKLKRQHYRKINV